MKKRKGGKCVLEIANLFKSNMKDEANSTSSFRLEIHVTYLELGLGVVGCLLIFSS